MTESDLWKTVRTASGMAGVHMSRVENSAGIGIPDSTMALNGREAWVELKVFKSGRLHFRTSQRDWIVRRAIAGGRIVVLARDENELSVWSAVDLVTMSDYKNEVPGKSFSVKPKDHILSSNALLAATFKPFDWEKISSAIFGLP